MQISKDSIYNGVDKINILGINVSTLSRKDALAKIEGFLIQGKHQIVTPNPEILLEASNDRELFDILNKAGLAVADGVGLKIAAWFLGKNLQRVAGADLLKDILRLAEEQGERVAVFNWQGGLSSAQDIARVLAGKYPKLHALAVDVGQGTDILESALARSLEFAPEIIFSTLGAPWQEKFIYHNLPNLPTVKIGLGVGGSFDYLTGRLPRAPLFLRQAGLEWLWRLIKQPRRWKRIYNAVIVFPVKFLIWRFAWKNLKKQ